MSDSADKHDNEGRLEQLRQALESGDAHQVRNLLSTLHSAEIADLLESIPHGPREILWELVDPDDLGETLVEVNDEVRAGLIDKMETDDLVAATEGLDADDLADLIQDLPQTVAGEVLRAMAADAEDRPEPDQLKKALATFRFLEALYGEDAVAQAIGTMIQRPSIELASMVDAIGRALADQHRALRFCRRRVADVRRR